MCASLRTTPNSERSLVFYRNVSAPVPLRVSLCPESNADTTVNLDSFYILFWVFQSTRDPAWMLASLSSKVKNKMRRKRSCALICNTGGSHAVGPSDGDRPKPPLHPCRCDTLANLKTKDNRLLLSHQQRKRELCGLQLSLHSILFLQTKSSQKKVHQIIKIILRCSGGTARQYKRRRSGAGRVTM
eukprot:gene9120-6410_t